MIKQCQAQGAPEPEFVLIRNVEFRTILPRDIYTDSILTKLGLNERQVEAVKFIKVGGRITNKEYQEKFGLKKRQSTDDLKELEDKGVLKRVGTTGRGTYYILKGRKGH
jgi:ATP-dependent DNA helicase RecG